MRFSILAIAAALLTTILAAPLKAEIKADPSPIKSTTPTAQATPTPEQVVEACTQNQAETLPVPFTDVSPDHWAFKAVMSMHFCGPGPFPGHDANHSVSKSSHSTALALT